MCRGWGWGWRREREREREGAGKRFAVSIFAEWEIGQDNLISGPADWLREHGIISSPAAQNFRKSD